MLSPDPSAVPNVLVFFSSLPTIFVVPLSQSDADGMLPLHYASWYGHPLCCQALLAANAEVDAFDHDGRSVTGSSFTFSPPTSLATAP